MAEGITGASEAVVADLLMGLGLSPDEVLALSQDVRIAKLEDADRDGRLAPGKLDSLRAAGLVPPAKSN
jgi:hypothetical protein